MDIYEMMVYNGGNSLLGSDSKAPVEQMQCCSASSRQMSCHSDKTQEKPPKFHTSNLKS